MCSKFWCISKNRQLLWWWQVHNCKSYSHNSKYQLNAIKPLISLGHKSLFFYKWTTINKMEFCPKPTQEIHTCTVTRICKTDLSSISLTYYGQNSFPCSNTLWVNAECVRYSREKWQKWMANQRTETVLFYETQICIILLLIFREYNLTSEKII